MNFYSFIKKFQKWLLNILIYRGDILMYNTGLEQDMTICLVDTNTALSGEWEDLHTNIRLDIALW